MIDPIGLIDESNINSELEEALEVGIEALRLLQKTNIRELKKKKSKE